MNSITSALLIMLKPFYFVHLTDSYFNSFCLLEQQHPDKRTMTKGFKKGSFPSAILNLAGLLSPFPAPPSTLGRSQEPRFRLLGARFQLKTFHSINVHSQEGSLNSVEVWSQMAISHSPVVLLYSMQLCSPSLQKSRLHLVSL